MTTRGGIAPCCVALAWLTAACEVPTEPPRARRIDPAAALVAARPASTAGAAESPRAPSHAATPAAAPRAGLEVQIAEGTLRLGSASGAPGRNAAREADEVPVVLAAFAIDALPYPNHPKLPALSGLTRDEAAARCTQQGKRLCSELEWERACKGDRGADYPAQGAFDAAACGRAALACQSAAGAYGLGTAGPEWTGSEAGAADWDTPGGAVIRGAVGDAPRESHRCAARDVAAPGSRSDSLFFRCCRGAPQAPRYPEQPVFPAFRELGVDEKSASELLGAMPETRALATQFRPFSAQSLRRAAAQNRAQQQMAGWQVAPGALRWSPGRGEEIAVLTGDTPQGAMLVAYYPGSDNAGTFAASFQTRGEHAPIVMGYKPNSRAELLFSTCWGCAGEGGALRLDAGARLRIAPR